METVAFKLQKRTENHHKNVINMVIFMKYTFIHESFRMVLWTGSIDLFKISDLNQSNSIIHTCFVNWIKDWIIWYIEKDLTQKNNICLKRIKSVWVANISTVFLTGSNDSLKISDSKEKICFFWLKRNKSIINWFVNLINWIIENHWLTESLESLIWKEQIDPIIKRII